MESEVRLVTVKEEQNIENKFLDLQHSIFQNEDTIAQESRASYDSYILGEIDKHSNYLDLKREENNIFLVNPPIKKCRPRIRQGRQCHNKIKDYTEDQESESEDDNASDGISWSDHSTLPVFCDDSSKVLGWFQKNKLIKSEVKCECCGHLMRWSINPKSKDGYDWRCRNNGCTKYKSGKSIRLGSFFAKSRISLPKWFDIMYLWSKQIGAKATSDQVNISRAAIVDCYSFFREVCEVYFKANPIKLGGPGITIEIDVSCLSHKPKRKYGPGIWVFGIVNTNCSPSIGYMEIVESSDAATLLPIILKVVQPGSIIHSNDWRAYRYIQGLLDTDATVNHSVNFFDVDTSEHRQTIESYWNKHKSYLKAMSGCRRSFLNSYLQEFMWRERFSDNALKSLCKQIAVQYSDASYIENTNDSSLGEETEKQKNDLEVKLGENANFLEKPPHKKCHPRVQQENLSKFQDSITVPSATDASYIHNTDDTSSGEKIEKHTKYLDVNLEENTNYLVDLPPENCCLGVEKERQSHNSASAEISLGDHSSLPLFCDDFSKVLQWFQLKKLIKTELRCDSCCLLMNWSKNSSVKDGYDWRCRNNECIKYKSGKSLRLGSFFAKSRISLPTWLDIMFLWSKHVAAKATSSRVNISCQTIVDCYGYFRKVCELHFKANPIKLGGSKVTLEIDAVCVSHKPKHKNEHEIWVLCIVDTNCSPSIGYVEIVETRDVTTFFPIILKVVQPGSIIHSKDWRAYRSLQGLSDTEETVNHSVNFVDVNTSVHKQIIDSYWNKHKIYIKAMSCCRRNFLNSYLQEYMWRERFSNNALESLCQQIAVQYSDASDINNTKYSCLGEEIEEQKKNLEVKLGENANFLEEPPNKFCSEVQQGRHSIYQDSITQEPSATDASNIENTDGSYSGEEIETHMNYLEVKLEENANLLEEPPPKKFCSEVQQGRHSIYQDSITQEPSGTAALNIENTDGSYTGEEIEKHMNYLEVKLGKNTNFLEEPPPKKICAEVQQGRHSKYQDSITQEPSATDALNIENTYDSYSGDEIERHMNYLEVKLEENTNYLEELPGQEKQCFSKVIDYTDDENPEPELESDNASYKISAGDHSSLPLFCEDSCKVLLWFQQNKLLKSEMSCDSCCNLMSCAKNSSSKDGYEWKCRTKDCMKFKSRKSMRLGSFFTNSRISLPKWFDIMYLWSEHVEIKATSNLVNVSHSPIVDCYSFFREICEAYFKNNPITLGGPGITIEIDVACFTGNLKNSHGQPPIWVLGIVDTNCSPSIGYMEIIESRDVDTLLPIILKVVQPGSIIYSEEWREYHKILDLGETDRIVNHTVNFLPRTCFLKNTSEGTQTIESYLNKHKSCIKAMHGCRRSFLNSYLQEFMWRERFSNNAFMCLCQQIAVQHPL